MSRNILVVEDNKDLARLLALHLRDLSYEVDLAFDGPSSISQTGPTNLGTQGFGSSVSVRCN